MTCKYCKDEFSQTLTAQLAQIIVRVKITIMLNYVSLLKRR